ncbi:uncharacterized protein A4U43_C01F6260 [Asparagus officinalis]|uniref:Uncharacterized protein n=1 Tax=Asparagus officinalis TaxID=4686 RepID=A0A5P1FPS3_ASPOF|nr:uncharacterized protein A4U43_C01F6260 [Asparagus officinalis]
MARVLAQTPAFFKPQTRTLIRSFPPSLLSPSRAKSNRAGKASFIEIDIGSSGSGSETEVEVHLGAKRLEDVLHGIYAQRSAPDWLPFVPGPHLASEIWVKLDLYQLMVVEGGNLMEHITIFKDLCDQLQKIDFKVKKGGKALLLLTSLFDSFNGLVIMMLFGKDSSHVEVQLVLVSHDTRRSLRDLNLRKGERRCGWRRRPEVALREVVNGGGARCGGGEVLGRGAWIWGSLASRLGRTWVAGDGGQRFGRQRGDCGGGRGRQRDREELGAVLELVLKIVKFWSFP